ncbi:MAG: lysylphosphatidylglycerol synthase transmembrane domain-containing protein [Candidatus Zixiibacteriota bacterium]
MTLKRSFVKLFQFLLIGVIFYFLIKGLLANWSQVKDFDWKFNYYLLTISFILQIITFLWLLKIWKWILRRTGSSVSYRRLFRAWFISNLGRYIPGKVWQFLGMIFLLEREGVPKKNTFSTGVLGQTLSVISGLLISALFLGSKVLSKNPVLMVLLIVFFIGVLALIFYPKLLERVMNSALRILKKDQILLDLKSKNIFFYFLCYSLAWLLSGLAFAIFIKAFTPASLQMYPGLTGAFAFSFNIGFLALFAPGGIGVREGVLVLLLEAYFPAPVAILVSILSRLWISVVELLCFLIALPLK